MKERLTWEEIQSKYPEQWVVLEDVVYVDDDQVTVESAVVKYAAKSEFDLAFNSDENIVVRHSALNKPFNLGLWGADLKQFIKNKKIARQLSADDPTSNMKERLTWKEIQERYPDQWVGLVNVKYVNDNGVSVESAVVKYTDKSEDDLVEMAIKGEVVAEYTTPDNAFQLGMLGVLG